MTFRELNIGDIITKYNHRLSTCDRYRITNIEKTLYSFEFTMQNEVNGKFEKLYIVKEFMNKSNYPENCDGGYLVKWQI